MHALRHAFCTWRRRIGFKTNEIRKGNKSKPIYCRQCYYKYIESQQTSGANEYQNKKFLLLILKKKKRIIPLTTFFFPHTWNDRSRKFVDAENKLVFLCNAWFRLAANKEHSTKWRTKNDQQKWSQRRILFLVFDLEKVKCGHLWWLLVIWLDSLFNNRLLLRSCCDDCRYFQFSRVFITNAVIEVPANYGKSLNISIHRHTDLLSQFIRCIEIY